jgi:hypothetical protein
MMSTSGIQTHDFLTRLNKLSEDFPPLLEELAGVMRQMIESIDRPQLEDVQKLYAELLSRIGDPARLRAVCGTEGRLCSQCPFGAYLPSGFAFASETQALCLPWIVIVHPHPSPPPAAAD